MSSLISLGIGSPASIKNFITYGLDVGGVSTSEFISLGIGSPSGISPFLLYGLKPSASQAPAIDTFRGFESFITDSAGYKSEITNSIGINSKIEH